MKKILSSLSCILLISLSVKAQSNAPYKSVGAWLGAAHYYGDLNTSTSILYPGVAGGFLIKNTITPRWAAKTSLSVAKLGFNEKNSKNAFQQVRNLSFKSILIELSEHVELNFLDYFREGDHPKYSPYIFTGLSFIYFNTNPKYTEKVYLPFTLAIPYGLGVKYKINYFWEMAVEVGVRTTFSDYIDDVSTVYYDENNPFGIAKKQRGDSKKMDKYMFVGVAIMHSWHKTRCPHPY